MASGKLGSNMHLFLYVISLADWDPNSYLPHVGPMLYPFGQTPGSMVIKLTTYHTCIIENVAN